jgi:hypothetical protein
MAAAAEVQQSTTARVLILEGALSVVHRALRRRHAQQHSAPSPQPAAAERARSSTQRRTGAREFAEARGSAFKARGEPCTRHATRSTRRAVHVAWHAACHARWSGGRAGYA